MTKNDKIKKVRKVTNLHTWDVYKKYTKVLFSLNYFILFLYFYKINSAIHAVDAEKYTISFVKLVGTFCNQILVGEIKMSNHK